MTGKSFLTRCLFPRRLNLAGRNLLVGPGLVDQTGGAQLYCANTRQKPALCLLAHNAPRAKGGQEVSER